MKQTTSTDKAATQTRSISQSDSSVGQNAVAIAPPDYGIDFIDSDQAVAVPLQRSSGPLIQAKLKIGPPDDKYEQEADRIADQVMAMPNPKLQRQPENEEEEETIQAKSKAGEAPEVTPAISSGIQSLQGGGQPLSRSQRRFFEPRIRYDFNNVRIHENAQAAKTAQSINAKAFTVGRDIAFGSGQYSPDTSEGKKILAHELTHVIQQNGPGSTPLQASNSIYYREEAQANNTVVQRRTSLDEQEFGRLPGLPGSDASVSRVTPPNTTASAPPSPSPLPAPGSFTSLSPAELADRTAHGMSRDTGSMIREIESELFPTGGSNPPCTPMPPNFEATVAAELSTALRTDVPSLTPAAAPDPMALASETANEAMPIIHTHYSPHAPSVSPGSFMARVSRKPVTYADPIRTNDSALAEFLSWYAGVRSNVRTLTSNRCGMNRAWWLGFAGWLSGLGSSWDSPPHDIRERSALFDTYLTSVTRGGTIQFGRASQMYFIPHTVTHEAMHLFQHPDLRAQVNLLQNLRSSRDIIIEGFAEYLARGVRDQVVTAIQGHTPPALSPADEILARAARAYPFYFNKAVEIRDILYRHGQDGEEAIRRAFFLGEGWRFGLLETAAGMGSPIESDRPLPSPVDVHFNTNRSVLLDSVVLDPIVAYLTTRSVATVEIVGRTDPRGTDTHNLALGQLRADATKAHLLGAGVDAGRISTSSRGEADQIAGGNAANRRATVTVNDPRNIFPGLPAPGRP